MDHPTNTDTGEGDPGIAFLHTRIVELSQDLIEHERTLALLRRRFDQLSQSATMRDEAARRQIASLQLALAERQKQLDAILTSRSWRMTALVRLMGSALRNIGYPDDSTNHDSKGLVLSALRWMLRRDPKVRKEKESGEPLHGNTSAVQERVWTSESQDLIDEPGSILRNGDGAPPARAWNRAEVLERAFEKMLSEARDNTGGGIYIHRVADYVDADKLDIKAVAFYTPQFYPILEEDECGFVGSAEWNDVTKALPRYLGQYQPQLPADFGFYDLRLPDVMRRQIELAKQYGLYGFCFRCYFLNGRHVFDRPFNQFLGDPSLEIRFCVCWSNKGLTVLQAGSEDGVKRRINVPEEDDLAFIDSLKTAFSDPRYICIEGKPLLICRAENLPDAFSSSRRWRTRVAEMGLPGVYLVAVGSAGARDPELIGFDAILQDPPSETVAEVTSEYPLIDRDFAGHIYSYSSTLEQFSRFTESPFVNFQNVVTGWDNEARKPGAGTSLAGASPALYARWLNRCCQSTMRRRPEERVLFITAWNDWAEGAHLEPDCKYGYAYLHATANVLRYYHNDSSTKALIEDINARFVPRSNVAIILHCYYEDLITPIFDEYISRAADADLFITVRFDVSEDAIQEMHKRFPNVFFLRHENRGRDIRPFLFALRHIRSRGYAFACKVHTKKTPQAESGEGKLWRENLMRPLLGSSDSMDRAIRAFAQETDLGLLVPKGSVTDLGMLQHHVENTFWLDRLLERMQRRDLIGEYPFSFPAGSMYWFRIDALAGFEDLMLEEDAFEYELGQRDGTKAHAVERLVSLYAQQRGYRMKEISESDNHSSVLQNPAG